MLPLPPPFPAQSVAGVLFSFWELMEEALVRCYKGLDCPLFLETRTGMYLLLFTRTSLQVSLILLAYPPLSAYQLRVQPPMEIQYFHSPQHCTSSISRRHAGCEECIKSTYIWMLKCLHLPALPPWLPLIVQTKRLPQRASQSLYPRLLSESPPEVLPSSPGSEGGEGDLFLYVGIPVQCISLVSVTVFHLPWIFSILISYGNKK